MISSSSSSDESENEDSRIGNNKWCLCDGHCRPMQTYTESLLSSIQTKFQTKCLINLLSRRQVKKKLSLFPRLLIRKKFTFHRQILFCLCFEWVLLACFSSFWTWVLHCTGLCLICKENIKKKLFNNKLRSGEWNHSEWFITKGWSQTYFKIERSKNKMIKLRGFMYAIFLLYRNEIPFFCAFTFLLFKSKWKYRWDSIIH